VRFLAETRQGGDVDARELREVDIDRPAWLRSKPGGGPGDWLLGVKRPQSRAPVDLFGWHLVICSSPLSCAATAAVRSNSGWPRQPQPSFFEGAGPYAQLLADPSIDASNSRAERLHKRWTKGHPGDTRASRLPAAVR
jgi:hypothetical protein